MQIQPRETFAEYQWQYTAMLHCRTVLESVLHEHLTERESMEAVPKWTSIVLILSQTSTVRSLSEPSPAKNRLRTG
jgi:hypothetical protein